ncbi:MAG: hypothetical protein KGH62_02080 [Candidatus Micrarchaeota archaeon]|nr:hypothetical protein [Candidatus Micrarchaeota archaeon]
MDWKQIVIAGIIGGLLGSLLVFWLGINNWNTLSFQNIGSSFLGSYSGGFIVGFLIGAGTLLIMKLLKLDKENLFKR